MAVCEAVGCFCSRASLQLAASGYVHFVCSDDPRPPLQYMGLHPALRTLTALSAAASSLSGWGGFGLSQLALQLQLLCECLGFFVSHCIVLPAAATAGLSETAALCGLCLAFLSVCWAPESAAQSLLSMSDVTRTASAAPHAWQGMLLGAHAQVIIIIARVSSRFIEHRAATLPRCHLRHHQAKPVVESAWARYTKPRPVIIPHTLSQSCLGASAAQHAAADAQVPGLILSVAATTTLVRAMLDVV